MDDDMFEDLHGHLDSDDEDDQLKDNNRGGDDEDGYDDDDDGMPKKKTIAQDANQPKDYENEFNAFDRDVLGAAVDAENDPALAMKRAEQQQQQGGEEYFAFFDFRRGADHWPKYAEFISPEKGEELIEQAREEALKKSDKDKDKDDEAAAAAAASGAKKTGVGQGGEGYTDDAYGEYVMMGPAAEGGMLPGYGAADFESSEEEVEDIYDPNYRPEDPTLSSINKAPEGAQFETLRDRSTALVIPAGWRLKLDVSSVTADGAERQKKKEKREKKKKKKGGKGGRDYRDFWASWTPKVVLNEYTITMDMKLRSEAPRDGIALFQTALVHSEGDATTGKKTVKQSDGECLINSAGGLGIFGQFGDTSKAKLTPGRWRRVVITVKCVKEGKGEMKTYIDAEPCAAIVRESFTQDGRFSIDPNQLFLFSSQKAGMMPGDVCIRTIRVQSGALTEEQIKEQRARDKIISMFEIEREEKIDNDRKGLSLAKIFPKPRPIWIAPTLVGAIGDAFIEQTVLEGASLLSWSYTVLNLALHQMLTEQKDFLAGFDLQESGTAADVVHIMRQSGLVMKQFLRLLKFPNDTQLLNFLKKLKKAIEALNIGESLVLPAIIEKVEMVVILDRVTEQQFRFVVVQTDPENGLRHHPVSPAVAPPKMKYRTCLVLNSVSKKNAVDNVFWMAFYNLSIRSHQGDMTRFYDVLIPFLTGKPLETSLVETEKFAKEGEVAKFGEWRSPQRSQTAYVRCILESLHYMLRARGLSNLRAKQFSLALRAQLVAMIDNDLDFVHPDDNGQRVCKLACSQLSYCTAKLVEHAQKKYANEGKEFASKALTRAHAMVTKVQEKLSSLVDDDVELPPILDLTTDKKKPASDTASTASSTSQSSSSAASSTTTDAPLLSPPEKEDESGEEITVKIKFNEKEVSVTVRVSNTVDELSRRIEKATGVPTSSQRLVYIGRLLRLGNKLSESNIKSNAVILLQIANRLDSVSTGRVSTTTGRVGVSDAATPIRAQDVDDDELEGGNRGQGTMGAFGEVEGQQRYRLALSNAKLKNNAGEIDPSKTQFMDSLSWDVEQSEPNPGHPLSLRKYVPIDTTLIPKKVTTRDEAVTAMRMCDRLCSLLDNQPHCIKNEKFLIASLIQHVFTNLIPLPKPRGVNDPDRERIAMRKQRRKEKERKKKAESRKALQTALEKSSGAASASSAPADADNETSKDDKKEITSIKAESDASKSTSSEGKSSADNSTPDFTVGAEVEKAYLLQDCIWDAPISYALQVELMLTLHRLVEHFAAAAYSIQLSRPFDAVCIVTLGCMTAVSDAVMRRLAYDHPSEVCSHLLGQTREGRQLGIPGFGIGIGFFVDQTETIEIHCPELSIARTAVIDYFQSSSQKKLAKMFSWETHYDLKPDINTIRYLRNICREVAIVEEPIYRLLVEYQVTESSKLKKNYPELKCYRDIVLWWKVFMNPDIKSFPNWINPKDMSAGDISSWPRLSAQMQWGWDDDKASFVVWIQNQSRTVRCRPSPDADERGEAFTKERQPPKHRHPSTATPSFYVPEPEIKTEDDVIYRANLPGFEDDLPSTKKTETQPRKKKDRWAKSAAARRQPVLGQHDSELLISYLTVPYLRLPLVLTFFASDDRLHKLQSQKLRGILDSVVFEPGAYLALELVGVSPVMVPTPHRQLLATPYGSLMNELTRSPDTVLQALDVMLEGAVALDTGSVCDYGAKDFNTSVDIILYITRLASRIENFVTYLVLYGRKDDGIPESDLLLRGVSVSNDCLKKLEAGRAKIRHRLQNEIGELIEDYLRRLDNETKKSKEDETLIDRNSRLAADLHAHKLLIHRNTQYDELTMDAARCLIGSFVFLTTRHTWNKYTRESGKLLVPETELYDVLQSQRRRLIDWCRNLQQGALDNVMQSALQISTSSTGSYRASAELVEAHNRWARIRGPRSCGRFAVGSTRTVADENKDNSRSGTPIAGSDSLVIPSKPSGGALLTRQRSEKSQVGEVADTGMLGVEMDLQIGQMTLRSKHLSALISTIANHPDTRLIFGTATIQASVIDRGEHRELYRLVGLHHDIEYWQTAHTDCPPLGEEWEREYDPSELYDSESWIPALFEPVRRSFFSGPMPPPMSFMLPDYPLPEDAEVAVILGLSQALGGPFKLVYVFRKLRCVHVYQVVSHGRRFWYTLHLATDVRFSLRELQPSYAPRQRQPPSWWRYGAGTPYPPHNSVPKHLYDDITDYGNPNPHISVVIYREAAHSENLSLGKEKFVPSRFLYGLVPQCLLDQYRFWQDECPDSYNGRFGYMRLRGYPIDEDGEYMIIIEVQNIRTLDVLGCLPGRTVRVIRRKKQQVEQDADQIRRIASFLESHRILIKPPKVHSRKNIKKAQLGDEESASLTSGNAADAIAQEDAVARSRYEKRMRAKKLAEEKKRAAAAATGGASGAGASSASRSRKDSDDDGADGDDEGAKKVEDIDDSSDEEEDMDIELPVGAVIGYILKKDSVQEAVITAVHHDDTYNIVFKSNGIYAGIELYRVHRRDICKAGKPAPAKREVKPGEKAGLGIYRWEGMSDSEEEDWATDSESESEKKDDEGKDVNKEALTFEQIDSIPTLVEAANGSEELLLQALKDISSSSEYASEMPFHDLNKLALKVEGWVKKQNPSDEDGKTATNARTAYRRFAQKDDMILLNLLYAPKHSRLYSLAQTLIRIENLSNICAWTKASNLDASDRIHRDIPATGCPPIDLVELPRLKLSFTAKMDYQGVTRLYSMDHANLFISNDRNPMINKMLVGIPHSLLLCNADGETQVLVPVISPQRPFIETEPFNTRLVLDRQDDRWSNLPQRYFLYPVHVSLSFLMTKGLDAALYLMLLRLLNRDYTQVFRLADSTATDTKYSDAGQVIFSSFRNANDDWHPDAHACRLKLALVTLDSGNRLPWDLTVHCAKYIVKLSHVSANCRMSIEEELQLFETENAVVYDEKSPGYRKYIHTPFILSLVKNRLHALRAIAQAKKSDATGAELTITAPCWAPPRLPLSSWPYYVDNTVFGEKYAEIEYITSREQWNQSLESAEYYDGKANSNPAGDLVLACFHVLWMETCVEAMTFAEEIASSYPACHVLSIRADSMEMEPVSKELEVVKFPTFIMFRNGKPLEGQRLEGVDAVKEGLVQLLMKNITEEDELAFKERSAAAAASSASSTSASTDGQDGLSSDGQKGADGSDLSEKDQALEWTWDADEGGAGFRVEELGLQAALHGDEDEDDVYWEWCPDPYGWGVSDDDTRWEGLAQESQVDLELLYKAGTLYNSDNSRQNISSGRSFQIWRSSINISSNIVKGFFACWDDDGSNFAVRRRGNRYIVQGEPEVDEVQKKKDKQLMRMKEQEKKYRKILAASTRGKDVQCIRGTVGLIPNSGIHKWTINWKTEPARGGRGDGVGLCSETYDKWGPTKEPTIGGDKDSASIGLYASGEVYRNGNVIAKVAHQRSAASLASVTNIAPQEEGKSATEKEATKEEAATAAVVDEAQLQKKKYKFAERVETVGLFKNGPGTVANVNPDNTYAIYMDDEDFLPSVGIDNLRKLIEVKEVYGPAMCWGMKSIVTVILDTDANNGVGKLTFEVDGEPVPEATVDNVFDVLGGPPLFPCLSLCPFEKPEEEDDDDDDNAFPIPATAAAPAAETAAADAKEEEEANENGEDGDEEDSDDEPEIKKETEEEKRARLTKEAKELLKLDQAVIDSLDTEAMNEMLVKYKANLAKSAPRFPTVVLVGKAPEPEQDENAKKADPSASAPPAPAGDAPPAAPSDGSQPPAEGDAPKPPEGGESAPAESTSATTSTDSTTTAAAATTVVAEDVPIDRIVWMYETEDGWRQYPKEVSAQIEKAKRMDKPDIQVRVGSSPVTIKFSGSKDGSGSNEPEQHSDSGQPCKVRRHVVSEGIRGMWEILSMKFLSTASRNLRGSTALEALEKIWSSEETMDGAKCGFGFLFLYSLLQGSVRCKIISSWGDGGFGGWSSFGFGRSSSSSANDSHRFGVLLAQLYANRKIKSICSSVVNVLSRNKQICLRMPKFKDTRKVKKVPVFNGWVDEREPRSPLADLFKHIVPTLQALKRKRGTIQFPPKPPHPELEAPPKEYTFTVPGAAPVSTIADRKMKRELDVRPEIGDLACDYRELHPVSSEEIAKLAQLVGMRVGSLALKSYEMQVVDDQKHFNDIVIGKKITVPDSGSASTNDPNKLVAVLFTAQWCSTCQTLTPVFRSLARKTPVVRFVKADIDECERLAEKFKIESIPTLVLLRGGGDTGNIVHPGLVGGGPKFVNLFEDIVDTLLSENDKQELADYRARYSGIIKPSIEEHMKEAQYMCTSTEDLKVLASAPLRVVSSQFVTQRTRQDLSLALVENSLPFEISTHDAARTAVAQSMLTRLKEDVKAWSDFTNSLPIEGIACIPDVTLLQIFSNDGSISEADVGSILAKAREGMKGLLASLTKLRNADAHVVNELLPLLDQAANFVPGLDDLTDPEHEEKVKFTLRRFAGQEPILWLEFLFGVLLSSTATDDLQRLNPYMTESVREVIMKATITVVLRASRVGHANRCIAGALKLDETLSNLQKLSAKDRIAKKDTMLPRIRQASESLAQVLAAGRYYIDVDSKFSFDPRYMIFEFTWNIMLRQKQFEIVKMFKENLANKNSKVKQMIMGAGKTTVVAPLLALMLADGKSLVLSVVPKALLEMSRTRMRETFASIMSKRIYTLKYDRSTVIHPSTYRSLENAARNRGIVVATPTTVKSIMLAYIEKLELLRDARVGRVSDSEVEKLTVQVSELAKILRIFHDGVMLLDEVDLLLHPLKSELNFPKGEKFDLDVSEAGERWGLPIHLLDAIFYAERGAVSTFEQKGAALEILNKISAIIEDGYKSRAFQRLPHITLLSLSFYSEKLKPLLAEWTYLWLQKQHLHGIDHEETLRYLLTGATPRSENAMKEKLIKAAIENVATGKGVDGVSSDILAKISNEEKTKELDLALKISTEQRTSIDKIYEMEAEYEQMVSSNMKTLGDLEASIEILTKKIKDAEFPRDDSLDNAVVVWFSFSFGVAHSASPNSARLNSINALNAMCSELENSGMTIKRYDTAEEALVRTRELQASGRLRCVICAGGEGINGCGNDCNNSHDGNCLRCGMGWGSHSGHNCQNGKRGSWPMDDEETNEEDGSEYVPFLQRITSSVGHAPLPANRLCVFGGHAKLPEEVRMTCWTMNVSILDVDTEIFQWVDAIPTWPQPEPTQDEPNLALTEEKTAEENPAEGNSDPSKEVLKIPSRPKLVKQISIGSVRLQKMRKDLEMLEEKKAKMLALDDTERKSMREKIAQKFADLKSLMDSRINDLNTLIAKNTSADLAISGKVSASPASGRDAALAIAYLKSQSNGDAQHRQWAIRMLQEECAFLEHATLAAKVMAFVSLQQKKLLNLSHDWLRTYLPHCLSKINRVSFGLLTDEYCNALLEEDPLVPRSRLKLAVPFVGKDVPSTASEFAHPDIIIGLTVLAYRYSGIRRTDFNDLIDALTVEFTHEIGPSRERPSSKRHESWVRSAGGTLRGIKDAPKKPSVGKDGALNPISQSSITSTTLAIEHLTPEEQEAREEKECVQLKYLQQSNMEQMDKLFNLIKLEPSCIIYYLNRFIFPAYMRNQRSKISASGQSIGGDMLFERRVGFSGTPSDLLPKELGTCDYERGDDGKMLSTVLDTNVVSSEFLDSSWNVEDLLKKIACSEEPRYHSLIDTGALITGYSNQQVAETLLKFGLPWCDGVVFLDENDKQRVFVRDTGRVVPADQCGVPLDRRFAFYDQIHTTGMDIQHVVNATAVMTLGKDMVFRDFVQGAYRMRGIGQGQCVRIFIIPEVVELMKRELRQVSGGFAPNVAETASPQKKILIEVVAWLVINSMRSEQTQWSMLCVQNLSNVYRKNAFNDLLKAYEEKGINTENSMFDKSLEVFNEPIDFSLEASVPDPSPFDVRLREMLDSHDEFIINDDQRKIADSVLEEVTRFSLFDGRTMERLDSEQEREQEQEQEKEVRVKKEQQIEIERFVEREYSRTEEATRPWHISFMAKAPKRDSKGNVDEDHPFFPLHEFNLRYQDPLAFPSFMNASIGYYNPKWTGLRRVKNVVMVLEYTHDVKSIVAVSPQETKEWVNMDEEALDKLKKAYRLFQGNSADVLLNIDGLKHVVGAATDVMLSDELSAELMAKYGNGEGFITLEGLRDLLTSGLIQKVEKNRHFVALSLAEAETLRRILHLQDSDEAKESPVQYALRYTPMSTLGSSHHVQSPYGLGESGVIFDASAAWRKGTSPATHTPHYMLVAAHNMFRFLDCHFHYTEHALNVLIRSLHRNKVFERERFFVSTMGCRRRMDRKPQDTPLSKVFTLSDEWAVLKQRAQSVFMRKGLADRKLTQWEAFTVFDADNNGVISPAEFYGALRFLEVPDLTPEDVVDIIEAADRNADGVIDYREYLDMLKEGKIGASHAGDDDDEEHEASSSALNDQDDDNGAEGSPGAEGNTDDESSDVVKRLPKVEPYGTDILRDIINGRRREAMNLQREAKLKRQAYQNQLDAKVFEEELITSRQRKGGANPKVLDDNTTYSTPFVVTEFSFTKLSYPIRMAPAGKVQFEGMRKPPVVKGEEANKFELKCESGHNLDSYNQWWSRCAICGRSQTAWRCSPCNYDVCSGCYDRAREQNIKRENDLTDKETYLSCIAGSSFSIQIPAASLGKGSSSSSGPGTGGVIDGSSFEEVRATRYSITLELRVEKLPPKKQHLALLRFAPTSHTRSRRQHVASVYVNSQGFILSGEGLQEDDRKLQEAEQAAKEKASASAASASSSTSTTTTTEEKKEEVDEVVSVKSGKWHVITISVNAEKGMFTGYVDGKQCGEPIYGLSSDDLVLHHQMIVLGGGKQAQSRGGHIRRLLIHSDELSPDDAKKVYDVCKKEINPAINWLAIEPPSDIPEYEKLSKCGYDITLKKSIDESIEAFKENCDKAKCFIVTLFKSNLDELLGMDKVLLYDDLDDDGKPRTGNVDLATSTFELCSRIRKVHPNVPIVVDMHLMDKTTKYKMGQRVSVNWRHYGTWYDAKVVAINADGTYDVQYDSDSSRETNVVLAQMKSLEKQKALTPEQSEIRNKGRDKKIILAMTADELMDFVSSLYLAPPITKEVKESATAATTPKEEEAKEEEKSNTA